MQLAQTKTLLLQEQQQQHAADLQRRESAALQRADFETVGALSRVVQIANGSYVCR